MKPTKANINNMSNKLSYAYKHGFNSVAAHPQYAPKNPYEEKVSPHEYEVWEEGATEAGMNDIYTNGVLNIKK